MKHGDFSILAGDYAASRPGYSELVLAGVIGMCPCLLEEIKVADIGAGTGIWTKMLSDAGVNSVIAVEPNDAMRYEGIRYTAGSSVEWLPGTAESTGLPTQSFDLLTMASAFHWADFEATVAEFGRVLQDDGLFVALWNPRLVTRNPVQEEIENYLHSLMGNSRSRVSSGFSPFTDRLNERLRASSSFGEVSYLEHEHVALFDRDRYLAVWRSVNDVRVQLGEQQFAEFLRYVETVIGDQDLIEVTYLTRAWLARKAS